jgi:hypothetical protein
LKVVHFFFFVFTAHGEGKQESVHDSIRRDLNFSLLLVFLVAGLPFSFDCLIFLIIPALFIFFHNLTILTRPRDDHQRQENPAQAIQLNNVLSVLQAPSVAVA